MRVIVSLTGICYGLEHVGFTKPRDRNWATCSPGGRTARGTAGLGLLLLCSASGPSSVRILELGSSPSLGSAQPWFGREGLWAKRTGRFLRARARPRETVKPNASPSIHAPDTRTRGPTSSVRVLLAARDDTIRAAPHRAPPRRKQQKSPAPTSSIQMKRYVCGSAWGTNDVKDRADHSILLCWVLDRERWPGREPRRYDNPAPIRPATRHVDGSGPPRAGRPRVC